MSHTVFIDGEAGTTGLQIRQRLEGRKDLEILSIDPAKRKDADARAELLNSADAVILCLPDDAAKEAVGLIHSNRVRVIDASTAYRTASASSTSSSRSKARACRVKPARSATACPRRSPTTNRPCARS